MGQSRAESLDQWTFCCDLTCIFAASLSGSFKKIRPTKALDNLSKNRYGQLYRSASSL